MVPRREYIIKITELLNNNPVVALIGLRQVGKTTLALEVAKEFSSATFFDLEDPAALSRLQDPMLALQTLEGLIVIDEVQHQPDFVQGAESPCRSIRSKEKIFNFRKRFTDFIKTNIRISSGQNCLP